MGLVTDTSTWSNALWAGHCQHSPSAQRLLRDATRFTAAFRPFSEDIHAALYLRHPCDPVPAAPRWAVDLLAQARTLPEWTALRARCARDGFAAGLATETVCAALVPLLPDEAPSAHDAGQADTADHARGEGDAKQLRAACRQAHRAIDAAQASMDAVRDALGVCAGTSTGTPETLHDLAQIRTLAARLRATPALQRIAAMAGRLTRLGQAHKRATLQVPDAGQLTGITLGGDLARVLPSALAGLRSPQRVLRLATLKHVLDKQALQYEHVDTTPAARGPILLCLDESGSMRGEAEEWTKAMALALLTTATAQHRAFWCCGFAATVTHEHLLAPGQATVDDVCALLTCQAKGGTSFAPPLTRALDVLRTAPTMRHADIIFVTDDDGTLDDATIDAVHQARRTLGLHVAVIGIGTTPTVLAPLADTLYTVSHDPDIDSPRIAPVIACP